MAARLRAMGNPRYQRDGNPRTSGPGFGLTVHPDKLDEPFTWRRPRIVFVNSMSDLFHKDVPDDFIADTFAVMEATPQHTYQVLTKRPARMASLLRRWAAEGIEPATNVWLGTSIETQHWAEIRIPKLLETPAAVRFLSCEPLLGPIDVTPWVQAGNLGWLIAGGESGPGARPMDPTWVGSLRDQCADAGVAFFFKQWGGRTPKAGGRELDGRIYDDLPAIAAAVG